MKKINNSLIKFLNKTFFNKKFVIFKDKLNAKPPGGKGFLHIMMEYFILKIKITFLKEDGMNTDFFINSLIAFDKCTEKNGTIEISKNNYKNSFFNLIKKYL